MSRKARFAALAVVVAITLAVLLWVAVTSPLMPWHVYSASDIQALPEAQLLFPGSTVIQAGSHDEILQGFFEPPQEADVTRVMTFTGSPFDVTPWFRKQLESNGWTKVPPAAHTYSYIWAKGHYTFVLSVCGDDVQTSPYMMGDPCTNRYFVKIFAF
jgi:hypothetical protein